MKIMDIENEERWSVENTGDPNCFKNHTVEPWPGGPVDGAASLAPKRPGCRHNPVGGVQEAAGGRPTFFKISPSP